MAKTIKGSKRPKKPEPIWTARNGQYCVEAYDFQLLKRTKPPADNPEIVYPEKFKRRGVPLEDVGRYEDIDDVGD